MTPCDDQMWPEITSKAHDKRNIPFAFHRIFIEAENTIDFTVKRAFLDFDISNRIFHILHFHYLEKKLRLKYLVLTEFWT